MMQEKRVSFATELSEHDAGELGENPMDLWYTRQDLASFRQRPSCEEGDSDGDGLRDNEKEVCRHRRSCTRRFFVRSLLERQSEHRKLGVNDPRGLYQCSKSMSKESKKRALQMAKSVAKECAMSKKDLIKMIDTVLDILEF